MNRRKNVTCREAYPWLLEHRKETAVFDSIRSLLAWDQRTFIPSRGHAHRAEQMAVLTKLLHSRRTNPIIAEKLGIKDDPVYFESSHHSSSSLSNLRLKEL
jgi:carboxypeptidase Taq